MRRHFARINQCYPKLQVMVINSAKVFTRFIILGFYNPTSISVALTVVHFPTKTSIDTITGLAYEF